MSQSVADRKLGGIFTDEAVDVTGLTLCMPTFVRCTVERREISPGDAETRLLGAQFVNCRLTGDGWPEWMVKAGASQFSGSDPAP